MFHCILLGHLRWLVEAGRGAQIKSEKWQNVWHIYKIIKMKKEGEGVLTGERKIIQNEEETGRKRAVILNLRNQVVFEKLYYDYNLQKEDAKI